MNTFNDETVAIIKYVTVKHYNTIKNTADEYGEDFKVDENNIECVKLSDINDDMDDCVGVLFYSEFLTDNLIKLYENNPDLVSEILVNEYKKKYGY